MEIYYQMISMFSLVYTHLVDFLASLFFLRHRGWVKEDRAIICALRVFPPRLDFRRLSLGQKAINLLILSLSNVDVIIIIYFGILKIKT